MGATQTRTVHRTWPIVYGHRRHAAPSVDARLAWALFLGLGVPLALMGTLTSLARAGIYFEPFRTLWQPWPPDLVKGFLGIAGFAATLAYLAHRLGWRSGLRAGTAAGLAAAWNEADRKAHTVRTGTARGSQPSAKTSAPRPPQPWE